jgi:hypothetical protein
MALDGATAFLFQKHKVSERFAIIAKLLDALLEIVLSQNDTLEYHVGLMFATFEFRWSCDSWQSSVTGTAF